MLTIEKYMSKINGRSNPLLTYLDMPLIIILLCLTFSIRSIANREGGYDFYTVLATNFMD